MVVIFPIYPIYPFIYISIIPYSGLFIYIIYPKQPMFLCSGAKKTSRPPQKKIQGSPPRRRAPNADLRWAGREWSFHQKLKTIKRVLVNLVDFGIFTYIKTKKINQMYRSVHIPNFKCCELWLILGAMIQKHHLVHKE